MSDFFYPSYDALRRSKRCSGPCGFLYELPAFARDSTKQSGRQSWCRGCKDVWESVPENAYKRFTEFLRKNNEKECLEPPHGWTRDLYLSMWRENDGKCGSCGALLTLWQRTGFRVDRIGNNGGHWPHNCRIVCWPCNRVKSNRNAQAFQQELEVYLQKYGWGRVPWDDTHGFARAKDPHDRVRKYRIGEPQLTLFPEVA